MKTLTKTVVVAFAAFVISGCGNDEPKIDSKLIGKWTFKSQEVQITVPGNDLFKYMVTTIGMDSTEALDYQHNLESGDAYRVEIETTEFKDNGSYESKDNNGQVGTGHWSISSDEKILTVDPGTDHEHSYPTTTLTDTNFTLKYDLTDQVGLPQLKYALLVTFEK